MNKFIKKDSEKVEKKENNDFYKLIGNRAKIVSESKDSVKFINYIKDDENKTVNDFTCWIPKKLIWKSEYSLTVTISIPKKWDKFQIESQSLQQTSEFNFNEFVELMGLKLKK